MANHAIQFFDKSFVATSRLNVSAAFSKVGGNAEYRPWSKHSKGSSKYDSLHKKEDGDNNEDHKMKDAVEEKEEIDEKLERKKKEFVDVIMGGKKSTANLFWANDDGVGGAKKSTKEPAQSVEPAKQSTKEPAQSVEQNQGVESASNSDESSASDSDDDSVDVMKTYKSEVSDMDFLKSKVLSNKEDLSDDEDDVEDDASSSAPSSDGSDSDSDSDEEQEDKGSSDDLKKEEVISAMDTTARSGEAAPVTTARLFLRNLPFSTTQDEIQEVFSPFGTIVECHIPVDDTDRNKGYAFVKFSLDEEASAAMETLDRTPFQGRLMHIIPAREEKNGGGNKESEANTEMTHKMKKELERQQDAGNSTGWNASFVRGDAVVDNLASRLGMDKGTILNVKDDLSSGNAAVRLALGETQVIEENRKYFETHGVDIEGLVSTKSDKNASGKRSSSMILVKNLPFDTSLEELSKVFIAVGGNKPQVLLPPSRTIALVIYSNNNDAKRAFRKLAYKRFKHVPLYLEWASLTKPIIKKPSDSNEADNTEVQENDEDQEALEEGESTSVYVKNLNFRTTEDELKRVFEQEVRNVRSVRIPTKVAAAKATRGVVDAPVRQSMGFGFVEFNSQAAAKKAILSLQGKVVDGHQIELKISKVNENTLSKAAGKKEKPSTKIIVRNVPFQASRKEILQLFGSFGQLKTVRLPKKYDGGHRGFAFVEFTGAKEALNAMKALASTHLYGRHLVIEWAAETAAETEKRDSASIGLPQPQNKKIRFD